MARMNWGESGQRFYGAGVDRGVLYAPNLVNGVPWSGLMSVSETPSGGEPQPYYLDGIKYVQVASSEEFNATIKALNAPDEFAICDGTSAIYAGLMVTQQPRKTFDFSYRTLIGNDVSSEVGYEIHLVYNALAKPSQRDNNSLSDSTDPVELSWDVTTVPKYISGYKASAHLIINSIKTDPDILSQIEDALYGSVSSDSGLLQPSEIVALYAA